VLALIIAMFLVSSAYEAFGLVPPENSWTTLEQLPIPSRCIAGANDKIYAIGGDGEYANVSYSCNAVLEYDLALDTWMAKAPLPNSMGPAVAAVYENKIYVLTESDGLNQLYDPATDTWENKTSMPTPRTQIMANVVNGKIYLIGGSSGLNEAYDPTTDTWTNKTAMPIGVNSYASAVVDNKIYFFGGADPDKRDLTQIYDADSDTWSFGASVPTPIHLAAAGATSGVLAPKRIYVIGGIADNYSLSGISTNRVYNPQNDSWTVGEPMPTARFQLHLTVLNDQLYVMGGLPYFSLGHAYCYENEQYTPIGYQPPTLSPPSSPQPQPTEPLSTLAIVAALLAIIVVAVVLLVYSRTRSKR
jgi:N-acetylneuraminic acid mutarotase